MVLFRVLVVVEECVADDDWSRLVWLWLRFWLVTVEDLDEVELGGLEFLLERIRDLASVEAIGKSSMLWLLDVVTDLGFDEDGDGDDIMLSEGFVEELFLWLIFGWSFGGDNAIGDDAGDEEDEEENESPAEVSPIRPRSRELFGGKVVHSVRSRGPVCPRPGPPRRIGAEEVDVPERFAEDCFWLDGLRGEDDGITVFD